MPPSSEPVAAAATPSRVDFRVIVAVVLLAAATVLTWQTIEGLAARRVVRTELAELSHARYGVLNADRWVAILTPILEARVDALDLTPKNGVSLKPMVQSALYRLLDEVKAKMSAPPAGGAAPSGGGFLSVGNPMVVNMIIGALKPRVPEFSDIVLKELGRPESREAVKAYLRSALADGAKTTFGNLDMTWHQSILQQYGCRDTADCQGKIGERIAGFDAEINKRYAGILGLTAAAFLLLMLGRPVLGAASAGVLLLFCLVLLVGGLFTPMLEVEAKITHLKMTFLGTPISFSDQVLYFQSKSVFEVFRALINTDRPDMWVVGVLVLMFSVVFPGLKLLASVAGLWKPGLVRGSRVVRFFALESSKWSMADVMALAIFMAFVAFNGLIGNSLGILRGTGADVLIPTDSSKILPGYYLFVGYCLASLFLSRKLAKSLA